MHEVHSRGRVWSLTFAHEKDPVPVVGAAVGVDYGRVGGEDELYPDQARRGGSLGGDVGRDFGEGNLLEDGGSVETSTSCSGAGILSEKDLVCGWVPFSWGGEEKEAFKFCQ